MNEVQKLVEAFHKNGALTVDEQERLLVIAALGPFAKNSIAIREDEFLVLEGDEDIDPEEFAAISDMVSTLAETRPLGMFILRKGVELSSIGDDQLRQCGLQRIPA